MADDKTERATPKRLEEAHRRGQVARSADLGGAVVLIAGLAAIALTGQHVLTLTGGAMREMLSAIGQPQELMTAAGLSRLFASTGQTIALALAPIAAACLVAGVLANLAQVGLKPATQALRPQPQRINPLQGARNVFGVNIVFETIKSVLKVAVVGVIVALAVVPKLTELAATVGMSPVMLGAELGATVLGIAQRAAVAYLLIAIVDYGYQRWRHARSLRMSKQEVKEEFKQHGLPAEVRGALRRRQMQAAKARMMAAIPTADVVVANPTHFAVALRYDGSKPAPEVVAKGQDLVALQIRALAEEHGVPVVEDKPLARSLHGMLEIGQLVPEELYQAVAQVLAYVYRVAGRRRIGTAAGGAR